MKSTFSEKKAAKAILQKQAVFNRNIPRRFVAMCLSMLPIKSRIRALYFLNFRKFPNLKTPKTFNEKLACYKLLNLPVFATCADKVLVKEYVRSKLGDGWVIPTIWAGKKLPAQEVMDTWQIPFVMKANHSSTWNLFVREESELNRGVINLVAEAWMNTSYGHEVGEMHY